MNKHELISRLNDLQQHQFIILSGGSLVMRGLREETNDVDLCVSDALATSMGLHAKQPNNKGYYELPGELDVTIGVDKVDYDIVDGYRCQSLASILKFKRERGLPKDKKDIEILEEYFAHQGRS